LNRLKIHSAHLSATLVAALDGAFMALYARGRRERRRFTKIALTLLPLMVLLMGSCKTETAASAYGPPGPAQFRAALLPVSADAHPAAGVVSRAQDYIREAPADIVKLTDREVSWLFGRPSMKRRDADARIWQYRAKSCVVDFYFYDDKGGQAPVSYVDVRASGAGVAKVPENLRAKCLGRVMDGAAI
jgi:hypothetical protein